MNDHKTQHFSQKKLFLNVLYLAVLTKVLKVCILEK